MRPGNFHLLFIFLSFCIVFGGCKKEMVWEPGMPLPREKIKVAIIHPNEINGNSLFDYAHYQGTLGMQRNSGLADSQIIRKVNVFEGDPVEIEAAMRDSIAEGANLIIATTYGYMDICEELAEEFPNVIFAQFTGTKKNDRNFTNYTTRLYHAWYLIGVAAGMKTQTGKIGMVAARGKDNSEVTRAVNAFAIGAEHSNPNARVYVHVTHSWYDPMGEAEAAHQLITGGCDVIAAYSDTPSAQIAAQRAGVWGFGFNGDMSADAPDAVICSVVYNWEIFYTSLVESVINGTFNAKPYLYGMAEGVVTITPINAELAAPGTEAAVVEEWHRILDGSFQVFDGVLETNDGRTVGAAGRTLSDEQILGNIHWYYRNVIEQSK